MFFFSRFVIKGSRVIGKQLVETVEFEKYFFKEEIIVYLYVDGKDLEESGEVIIYDKEGRIFGVKISG